MTPYVSATQANQILANLTASETPSKQISLACITDKHANCIFANQAWQTFTGRDQSKTLGENWLHAIHLLDVQRFLRVYRAACAASVAFVTHYRLRRSDGTYISIQHEGSPQTQPDGSLSGYINILLDASSIQQVRDDFQWQQVVLRDARDIVDRLKQVLLASSRTDALDETLKLILDHALSLLHAQAGIVFRFDVAQQRLMPAVCVGFPTGFAQQLSTLLGEGLIGQVAQQLSIQTEPIEWSVNMLAGLQESSDEARCRLNQFIQMFTHAIAAPLTIVRQEDTAILGVLAFYKQASAQFQPDQINILEALALQISTILSTDQRFIEANSSMTFRL